MSRLTDERGQSTLEYVALMALLAVLVTAAGAATMAPTYVNAAMGGFQRALCIATGRECRSLDEQACVVRSNSERNTLTATIAFVRLEDGRLLLQERLSDGRIRITVTDESGIGGEIGIGASAGVNVGGIKLDASAVANASLLGLYGRGRTYVARNAGEAQRLVRQIQSGDARDADVTFHEGGLRGDASASAGAGASIGAESKREQPEDGEDDKDKDGKDEDDAGFNSEPLVEASAEVQASLRRAVGHRKDRRTGETTWYLRADNEVSASAGVSVVGAGDAGADAPAHANGMLSVTTNRRGRVVAIGALATYGTGAGYEVSGGPSDSVGGRRHEIEVTADPDDPTILAALRAFGDGPSPSALKTLTQAVYGHGRVDRRAYEVDEDSEGAGGSLALGAKVGAGYEQATENARLVEASTRPPGGVWERRFDCLERA
ncbi:MAG: hypothetical protein ACSLFR_15595 [Solirubrobacteraceae bacterium]